MAWRRTLLVSAICATALGVASTAALSSSHGLRVSRSAAARRPCVVPKVTGKSLSVAKKAIKRGGCSVGAVRHAFSTRVARGRVVSQRPAPKSRRKPLAKVSLVVSKGRALPVHVRKKLAADSPEGTLGAFGAVWVANHRALQVSRLDPNTGKTVAKIPAGSGVGGPVAGPDAVWAVGEEDGSITRMDPATNTGSTFNSPFSALCGLSAATPGALWVDVCGDTGFHASLDRIDATTHQVTATIPVGNGVDTMVPVGTTIWAADYDPAEIVQFDAATGLVLRRIPVNGCPLLTQTAYAYGYLWVGQKDSDDTEPCTGQPTVLRIDPTTGAVTPIVVGGPAWVATGDGYVWASARDQAGTHQLIKRIDPASLAVTTWTKLPMSEQPDGLAFQNSALWVGWFSQYALWVVSTK